MMSSNMSAHLNIVVKWSDFEVMSIYIAKLKEKLLRRIKEETFSQNIG